MICGGCYGVRFLPLSPSALLNPNFGKIDYRWENGTSLLPLRSQLESSLTVSD